MASKTLQRILPETVKTAAPRGYCIRSHTKVATGEGATPEELMEAIWIAAEMRAGGAVAHSAIALDALAEDHAHDAQE